MKNTMEQQQQATAANSGESTRDRVRSYIAAHPGTSMAEVAEALGVAVSTICLHVHGLRRDGHLASARRHQARSLRLLDAPESIEDRMNRQRSVLRQARLLSRSLFHNIGGVTSVTELTDIYNQAQQLAELLNE